MTFLSVAVAGLMAWSTPSFGGDTQVHCVGKKFTIEVQIPEREKVQLSVKGAKAELTKETWVFAMNRKGEAIVPEELTITVGKVDDPRMEVRLENLRLCGDIDGVRVRVFDVAAGNRTFLEETPCTCKTR